MARLKAIQLSQDSEVRYWTHELAVDEAALRRAIACVGTEEVDVRTYLMTACLSLSTGPAPDSEPDDMPGTCCA